MDTHQAIRLALDSSQMIAMAYLEDLTDEEMLQRPVPGSNHVKWQLGHLIASEHRMVGLCFPDLAPSLPDDFEPRYAKERAKLDDPAEFDDKTALLESFRIQRQATLAALDSVPDPDQLDLETDPSIRSYAPTVGSVFILQSTHWMMHAGQWAVLRRKLGRAPIF